VVAVMSGLLYISEINARRRVPDTPLLDAVIRGARAHFRPRLILIVAAGLGMPPAAPARGIGSDPAPISPPLSWAACAWNSYWRSSRCLPFPG